MGNAIMDLAIAHKDAKAATKKSKKLKKAAKANKEAAVAATFRISKIAKHSTNYWNPAQSAIHQRKKDESINNKVKQYKLDKAEFDNQEKEKRKQQRLTSVKKLRDNRILQREEQFSLRVGYGDVVVIPSKKKTSPKWNPAQAAREQRSLLQKNKKRKYDSSSSKNKQHTSNMKIHLPNLLK